MATHILTQPVQRTRKADGRSSAVRRRVCHVSMTLQTGGLERLLVDFGRYHDRERYQLRFVALDQLGPPAEDLQSMGLPVQSLEYASRGKVAILDGLRRLFREHQIDIVHTHNTYAHFYSSLAAKLAGVPIVINTQHGRGCGHGWKDRLQFRLANRLTKKIVGVSDDAAALCRKQDPGSAVKILRIWNGIDLNRFPFSGPRDCPIAISVARLSREKDFPTLLRGTAIALKKVPDLQLKIVGDGVERDSLEKLAHELNISDAVEFLGERADVSALLTQAGFFVSSSKTEGISLTLLEAMAVGLPILTTRVGGNPEIVDDPTTGMIVEPLNPDAIATGIIQMCRRQSEWPAMGRQGRQRVEQYFEITSMIQRYEALYAECLRPSG